MRWTTFQLPGSDADQIHALAPGQRLIDLLGDNGERLARAGERAVADPAAVVGATRFACSRRFPVPRPCDFMTFR